MVVISASGLYTLYRPKPEVVSAYRRKVCESQKSRQTAVSAYRRKVGKQLFLRIAEKSGKDVFAYRQKKGRQTAVSAYRRKVCEKEG